MNEKNEILYFLYILRCENNSLYTGIAKDYLKRYELHISGKGAKYTKIYKPIRIETVFECHNLSIALSLEKKIKKLKKIQKEDIINGSLEIISSFETAKNTRVKKIL